MLDQIFITAFIVMAIWATFWPDAIFGKVADWLGEKLPERLHDPVFDCVVCMSFWYGSAAYWLIWGDSVKGWAVVVVAAMGVNAALVKLFPQKD